MKNILLLCGGDGAEHQISLISADFIEKKINEIGEYNVIRAEIHNKKFILKDGSAGYFDKDSRFVTGSDCLDIYCAVPCIHGVPGETGDIQSFLEIFNIPYIGCKSEASHNCFNKITTKLYLTALNIPNTPFLIVPRQDELSKANALKAFDSWQDVYVKAASQGSSIGCYHVTKKEDLWDSVVEAFTFSEDVIIEKTIKHRELECAAYEIDGNIYITNPGEIIMPDNLFYTFDEKYSKDSGSVTTVEPQNLSDEIKQMIPQPLHSYSEDFQKLRHIKTVHIEPELSEQSISIFNKHTISIKEEGEYNTNNEQVPASFFIPENFDEFLKRIEL